MTEYIALDKIDFTPAESVRARRDADTVEQYKEAYQSEEKLPPIKVFRSGVRAFAGDGWHRGEGRRAAGYDSVLCDVTECDGVELAERMAYRHALAANHT